MSRPSLLPSIALLLAALSVGSAQAAEDPKAPAERPAAAEFALETLAGKRVSLSDHEGKVVVISFWASWCKSCMRELPFLDEFAKKYADQGLVVLAINTDDPRTLPEVRRIVKRKRLKIPQLLDKEGAVLAALNPRGVMPFSLYLDRNHGIAETHDSFSSGDEVKIEAAIQRLLAEKTPAR